MAVAPNVLDRDSAVLVVIDVQDRLAQAMAHRVRVVGAISLLVRTAMIVGLPVIVTRQYPAGLGDHVPEIGMVLDEARGESAQVTQVDKTSFDCFAEPGFVRALEQTSRDQILIAGMETHICVCQTALAALRAGRDVHVAADACCSRADENHAQALARLAHAGATVSTSESAAYELVREAGTPEFKALLAAVKGQPPFS